MLLTLIALSLYALAMWARERRARPVPVRTRRRD
jgi:hypothetical protein